jgi:hypothetical protein
MSAVATLAESMPITHLGGPSLTFYCPGRPQTAGSKTIVPTKAGARVVDGGTKESRAAKVTWRGDLRDAAIRALDVQSWQHAIAEQALALDLVIVRRRPSAHLTTGKAAGLVKDWARDLLPIARPDTVKLTRAAEDALTGIVWADDSQIVRHRLHKAFGDQVGLRPIDEGALLVVTFATAYEGPRVDTGGIASVSSLA